MPDSAPYITVIIATYNYSSVLRYSIESVLWQTQSDFELLVVGDGCTDDSAEVVASFGNPRIHWHNLPENSGTQSAPNNYGLEKARGKYVAYIGHDDLWYPTHLEHLTEQLEHEDADWGNSLMLRIGPSEFPYRLLVGYQREKRGDVTPTCLMHRREIGLDARWPSRAELPPLATSEIVFIERLLERQTRGATLRELTSFKFPASHRKDSYILKPFEDQAKFSVRMRDDPEFIVNELIDCAIAYASDDNYEPAVIGVQPDSITPGYMIDVLRRLRGLSVLDEKNQDVTLEFESGPKYMRRVVSDYQTYLDDTLPYWENLAAEVKRLAAEKAAQEAKVQEASAQLKEMVIDRDRLRSQLAVSKEQSRAVQEQVQIAQEQLTLEQQRMSAMRQTRAWRLATHYWRIRDWLLKRT